MEVVYNTISISVFLGKNRKPLKMNAFNKYLLKNLSARSTTDRTRPSEGRDRGSIPRERTRR